MPGVKRWPPRALVARNAGMRTVLDTVPSASTVSSSAVRKRLTRRRGPVDDDVAQIARQRDGADGGAAGRRQADQLAVRAGDVHEVGRRVVGDAARRRADRAALEDLRP